MLQACRVSVVSTDYLPRRPAQLRIRAVQPHDDQGRVVGRTRAGKQVDAQGVGHLFGREGSVGGEGSRRGSGEAGKTRVVSSLRRSIRPLV